MSDRIPDGIWPTMITPFTEQNEIDYGDLETLIEWYLARGVSGLFAVCQSSEMFFLSLAERVELARFVQQQTAGRVPVIASGHISDDLQDQITEIGALAETGAAAVVLVTNRFAVPDAPESAWQRHAEAILQQFPDLDFGLYECPYPYKRLLSPELLGWCAASGRFLFLKDTCCDLAQLKAKAAAVASSRLKIFNADEPTLLGSLAYGLAGYSGIMANFHPELYVWLWRHWRDTPERAARLHAFLSEAKAQIVDQYPVTAKYFLHLEGQLTSLRTRARDAAEFDAERRETVTALHARSADYSAAYPL